MLTLIQQYETDTDMSSTVLPRLFLIYEHVHFPRGVIGNRSVRYQQAYSYKTNTINNTEILFMCSYTIHIDSYDTLNYCQYEPSV